MIGSKNPFQALVIAALSAAVFAVGSPTPCAADNWTAVDKQVESRVFRVNVAIRVTLRNHLFAQLADLSPSKHYPVFAAIYDDMGLRVVGYGTCFPVRTTKDGGTYFLTNEHVVDFGDGMIEECQRFFAAVRLHAERTAGLQGTEDRYHDLLRVINLSLKKGLRGAERQTYQATVDAIWQTYDNELSLKADPSRERFHKYLDESECKGVVGFFIHEKGSSTKAPIMASLYKRSTGNPDLAVLYAKNEKLPGLPLETTLSHRGEVVQAVGYPAIKQTGVLVPTAYEPTVTAGTVQRVLPDKVEFAAPVSRGDSGGPLLNEKGKVVGVVARRALLMRGIDTGLHEDDRFAAAISADAVRQFAPELFQ
jgi:hypothetical protein